MGDTIVKISKYVLQKCGSTYLLKNQITEPDCTMLPRLNQVNVIGLRANAGWQSKVADCFDRFAGSEMMSSHPIERN